MKRKTALLLMFGMVLIGLTGCGKEQAPVRPEELENLPPVTQGMIEIIEETTEATTAPTEPDSIPGTVIVNKAGAILTRLPRGAQVEVLREYDDRIAVNTAAGTGFMEKRLLRMNDQLAPESWTGYSKWNAVLYDSYHMTGEGTKLKTNTQFEVLEDLDGCYLVQTENGIGYISADSVSNYPIRSSSGGSGGSGGGSSGGSSGGGGNSGGQDGGDISLTACRPDDFKVVLLSNQVTATMLADDAEVYLMYLDRGDTVKVTEYDENTCTVYLDGVYAQLPRMFVRLEEDVPYEPWTAYARWNAEAYDNPYLTGEPAQRLKTNTEMTILEDLGYCYVAEIEDEIFCLRPERVSKWKATSGGHSNSDGGSGGSDGGSGGGGGSSGGGEWTPPAL